MIEKERKKLNDIGNIFIQFIQLDLFMGLLVTFLTRITFIKMFQFHDDFQYKLHLI